MNSISFRGTIVYRVTMTISHQYQTQWDIPFNPVIYNKLTKFMHPMSPNTKYLIQTPEPIKFNLEYIKFTRNPSPISIPKYSVLENLKIQTTYKHRSWLLTNPAKTPIKHRETPKRTNSNELQIVYNQAWRKNFNESKLRNWAWQTWSKTQIAIYLRKGWNRTYKLRNWGWQTMEFHPREE